jgi:hypothetical protein
MTTEYRIVLIGGAEIKFKGRYCRKFEAANWHYYEDDAGRIYHIPKRNILYVVSKGNNGGE